MKASELRIGNLVEIIQSKKCIYTTIEASCFSVDVEKNYKPIPLTKDWLLKFGFEENFKQYELQNYGLKVVKDVNSNVWICYVGFPNQFNEICSIKFVHELQNLYFALTGTELEIK